MIRGNERKNIFNDEEDKLREGSEDIASVMKRTNGSYVYFFNQKYKRVGHLFRFW